MGKEGSPLYKSVYSVLWSLLCPRGIWRCCRFYFWLFAAPLQKSGSLGRSGRLICLVQAIRALTIGSVLPAGTGGTQVADTLNIPQALKFAFSHGGVCGINAGPEHLNGCPWGRARVKVAILADMAVLLWYAACYPACSGLRKGQKMGALGKRSSLCGLYCLQHCLIQCYDPGGAGWVYVAGRSAAVPFYGFTGN